MKSISSVSSNMVPLDVICIIGSLVACCACCISVNRKRTGRHSGKFLEPVEFDEPPNLISVGFNRNAPVKLDGRILETKGPEYTWLQTTMRDPAIPSIASDFSWTTNQWASPRPPLSSNYFLPSSHQ